MTDLSSYESLEQWDKVFELVKADNKILQEIDFLSVYSSGADYIIQSKFDQLKIIDELINYCISIGYKPTNLPQAAFVGNLNLIKDLLSHGHDINETEFLSMTALMVAALRDNIQIVQFFFDNNADDYIEDWANNKAIDYAKKRTEVFNLLKSSGVMTREEMNEAMDEYSIAVDFANDFRDTQIEFMTGAEKGDINKMESALSRPKGIWVLNGSYPVNGKTALHLAVEKNKIESVKFLISKGLDKNKTDHSGETPVQMAKRLNLTDIEKLLNEN